MEESMSKSVVIIAIIVTALLSGDAHAQGGGGGGLGITRGTPKPYITGPYNKEEDAGGCIWRREWIVDERGRRVLRRIRVCY
jgi:hypothetical protein